jgi:PilZ domain
MRAFMASSTNKRERRKKTRKRPLSLVYVELASGNGGMMRDLSEEGFAMRAMMPLRAGELTPFTFALDEFTRVEGRGEILWAEEGGRLAGVRFTEISPEALEQIEEWLTRPDAPLKPEKGGGKKEPAPNPTLEQLRQEMYTVPPRPDGAMPMEPPGTNAVVEAPVMQAESPSTANASVTARVEPPPEPVQPPEVKTPRSAPSDVRREEAHSDAPALPRLTLTPRVIEPDVAVSENGHTATREPEAVAVKQHWRTAPADETAEEDEGGGEAASRLPDISAILMQPPGKAPTVEPAAMPAVETLPPWVGSIPAEGSTERFPLKGLFAFMTLLALVVGVYVFRSEVGAGLIWLGQAMGGGQETQSQSAGPQNNSAPVTRTGNAGEPVANTSQPATGGDAGKSEPAGADGKNNQAAKQNPNPSSPVAPLSGMNVPAGGTESGQPEYMQAIAILRGKNADVDAPEALRLLWISVEKGNPNAEIELADMYWHGRGVIQNCDQTLILLTAAARKGNAEAQKLLLQFQKQGCE